MKIHLPKPGKDKRQLEHALNQHYQTAERELLNRAITWTRMHYYLQGIRNFQSYWGAEVAAGTHDTEMGRRVVRWERTLSIIQTLIGRIMSIDIRPAVVHPEGIGIGAIRDAAMAQAVLDHLSKKLQLDTLKPTLAYHLCAHGTVGLSVSAENAPGVGTNLTATVVPTWELMPLPGFPSGVHDLCGLIRRRWVSYDWLKKSMEGIAKLPPPEDVGAREGHPGVKYHNSGDPVGGASQHTSGEFVGTGPYDDVRRKTPMNLTQGGPGREHYVLLKEYFWDGPFPYTLGRWTVMVGNVIVHDTEYFDRETQSINDRLPISPIHVMRFLELGSFYGRGMADRLSGFNRAIEETWANVFKNLAEIDWMGLTAIPTGMGVNTRNFKDAVKAGVIMYDADVTQPRMGPQQIAPANTGDMGVRSVGAASGFLDMLSNQSELFSGQAQGRVESARGLGVLMEAANVPMAPVSESLASGMKGVYMAMLDAAPSILMGDTGDVQFPLSIERLDETLLGLRVEQDGSIKASPREIPNPLDVMITIRNKAPESKQHRLATLDQLLAQGIVSRVEYIITAMRDGLGLPLIDRALWESYRKAWWENLVLFGDGINPGGPIRGSERGDNHDIHRMVLKELMSTTAYSVSSEQVQQAIIEHYQYHESYLGAVPDDLTTAPELGGITDQPLPPQVQQQLMQAQGPPQGAPMMGMGGIQGAA